MAILTRPKRLNPSVVPSATPPTVSPRAPREAEAPDGGWREHEAPETRITRHREAPDAGEGRASYLEQEFTRGRSQS